MKRLTPALVSAVLLAILLAPRFAFAAGGISPVDAPFSCVGDGVADDTVCLGKAIAAAKAAGEPLVLGPHRYLTSGGYSDGCGNTPIMIQGAGAGWTAAKASQIIAKTANETIFTFCGAGSYLRDAYIKAAPNPTGPVIVMTGTSDSLDWDWIDSPCIGIDLMGNTNTIDHTYISSVAGSGCMGIRVGYRTTDANTVDPSVTNTTIQGEQSARPDADMEIYDAGGMYMTNDAFLYGRVGTLIRPGAKQWIAWLFASNTVLGDSTQNQSLLIDTDAPTAEITGLQIIGSWGATVASGSTVEIFNRKSGLVAGVYLTANRFFNALGPNSSGIRLNSGISDINVDNNQICGWNAFGVYVVQGLDRVRIRNNTIQPRCANNAGTGATGIRFAGAAGVIVTGNDFGATQTPIVGSPTGNSVVADNIGLDTASGAVASAPRITLSNALSTYLIKGTTGVSTIDGYWNGRKVMLITTEGAVPFSTGGNICNALTSTRNTPVLATYVSASGCWYLK